MKGDLADNVLLKSRRFHSEVVAAHRQLREYVTAAGVSGPFPDVVGFDILQGHRGAGDRRSGRVRHASA